MNNQYISTSAKFSMDRIYRYVLWRKWNLSEKYVMFIGLNPSTADETEDDPTIRRCVQFAKDWGYGGLCMMNLFAFRATKPEIMMAYYSPVGIDNNIWLKRLTSKADIIIAAWGTNGNYTNRDQKVMSLIPELKCLGTTKDGYPRHPLYLQKNTKLISFNKELNNG